MHGSNKDLQKLYQRLKPYCYPKNGSWKDAVALKNVALATAIVMTTIVAALAIGPVR